MPSNIPNKIKIGHKIIKVAPWAPAQGVTHQAYGMYSSSEDTIYYDDKFPVQRLRDTLLHEIMHAIYYEWNMDDSDIEERVVGTFATALTTVMIDNPEWNNWFNNAWRNTNE